MYVQQDGITWTVTRGRPQMSQLENMLAEVKSLYKTKYGEDVESDDEEENQTKYVQHDGITWTVTRGRPQMSQLENMLAEVKSLYKTKYGEDVESDEEEEDQTKYVEMDGITWTVTRGRPQMSKL